jgi:ferredoxin-type protein NapF
MDSSRRALFRGRFSQKGKVQPVITMPWMLPLETFTDKCTRCSECIDVCPESVLEKGDGGFPTINFQKGECTFCGDCVDACDMPVFKSKEEKPWDLVAEIVKDASASVSLDGACMAYQGVMCQSCKDVCDVRAVKLNYSALGMPVPEVNNELCTGCGACVSVCPTSAIKIQSGASA